MYQVLEDVASANDFIRLRQISGLSPRPFAGAIKALPRSLYGVR
jgi:hypothetical protein